MKDYVFKVTLKDGTEIKALEGFFVARVAENFTECHYLCNGEFIAEQLDFLIEEYLRHGFITKDALYDIVENARDDPY